MATFDPFTRTYGNPYTGGDPNTFLQRSYGALPNPSTGRRFSGRPSGQPVIDAVMGIVDSGSGLPFSGALGTTGKYVVNGKVTDTNPNALPAKPDFERQALYPETANLLPGLTKNITATRTIDPYQLMAEAKAANTTALNSYGANTADLAGKLDTYQKANEGEQRGVLSDFAKTNEQQRKDLADALERMNANIASINALNTTAGQASAALAASTARFPGVGGGDTITSNNAALAPRIARANLLPLLNANMQNLARSNAVIQDVQIPGNVRNTQSDQALLTFTSGLVDKFYGDKFKTATFLNERLNWLASLPPQMQEQEATLLLRMLGGEQSLLAGQLSNLSAVQQLRVASEYLKRNIPEPATLPLQSYPVSTPNMGGQPVRQQPTLEDLMRLLSQQQGVAPTPVVAAPRPVNWQNYFNANPTAFPREAPGVYDLPNDYTWNRSPQQQRAFEDIQASYQ